MAADVEHQAGAVVVGIGVIRADGDGAIEVHGGRGRPIERPQRRAAIVQGFDVARLEGECTVVDGDRLLVASEFLQHDAEVRQHLDRGRIDPVGRGDQRMGLAVPALLVAHQAEQVQRFELPRLIGENLAIEQLGGGEVAGLVKFKRPAEPMVDVD